MPPLSLDDCMEEESPIPPVQTFPSLFINSNPMMSHNTSRKIDQNLKDRVNSKSIFKKKNLSKQRQLKNGNTHRGLPVLALNKSSSQDLRQRKTSTLNKVGKPGMSIFDFLMKNRQI